MEGGFRKAAAFLQSQFIFGRYNVPYNTQLVPLAALYVELDTELEPALARDKLARWYWSGIFGERYGGTTEDPICAGRSSSRGVCQRGCRPYPNCPGKLHTRETADAPHPQQRGLQGLIRIADEERGE